MNLSSQQISQLYEEPLATAFEVGAFSTGEAFSSLRGMRNTTRWGPTSEHPELWDIASLTKVVCTWPLIGRLLSKTESNLNSTAGELLGLRDLPGSSTTLLQLLTHTSRLRASTRFDTYSDAALADLGRLMLEEPLDTRPEQVLYINRGFVTLGKIVEQSTGLSLQAAFHQMASELSMHSASFGDATSQSEKFHLVATGASPGLIHDPNARRIGGAGHAGVFCAAKDLLGFGEHLVRSWHGEGLLSSQWLRASMSPLFAEGDSWRGLAWRVGIADSGRVYAFHYGFTGCGLYVVPEARLVIGFLTDSVAIGERNPDLQAARYSIEDSLKACA